MFSLRSRIRQGCPHSSLHLNIGLEVLARAVSQEKEIKGIQTGKEEVKLSLFADDTILYVGNPEDSTKKTLKELINEFSKVGRIQSQHTKISCISNTNNKQPEKEITKTIPFIIALERIKYLGIN